MESAREQVATTRLSSKGQVVIPEEIRTRLHLEPGTRFVVIGEGDAVVLKAIHPPSPDEFDALLTEARKRAAATGLTSDDIDRIVREVRSGT